MINAIQNPEPKGGDLVKRHRLSTRLWHWFNAFTIFTMIGSGLMIFNAHPRLYWGQYGANYETPWLEIAHNDTQGVLRIGPAAFITTGVLGLSHESDGSVNTNAFPSWATLPSQYDLAKARRWHLFFAWVLVVPWLFYALWSLINRHIQRDLTPTRAELAPRHILHDIGEHARLRFPTGAAALHHNILQKLSYLAVLFVLIPTMILSGLTLSPGMTAAWPWLLILMGGRASARAVHFIGMGLIVGFIIVHLLMVVLAGPFNEVRSMITGKFRLPKEKG
jgi:thiosulfate reductase cytochrome b subunit